MTKTVLVFVAVMAAVVAASQAPVTPPPEREAPPERSKLKPNEFDVIVRGCVRGNRLEQAKGRTPDVALNTLGASEFVLTGPREMLQQIRQSHEGHYVEVAGIATVPQSPGGGTRDVNTTKLGPVRIGVGARERSGPIADPEQPIRLRVSSLTHLEEGCVSAR